MCAVNSKSLVTVVGAGLAGSEATWQIIRQGIPVKLVEMRPALSSSAHKTSLCAELVCSNSLRGAALTNAVGLLKQELKLLNSLIIDSALKTQVPAGGALAVDRLQFSSLVDAILRNHPLVQVVTEEITSIPPSSANSPVIIASGPLTSDALAQAIRTLTGSEHLAFYDAISPVLLRSSLNLDEMFAQSRYDKGEGKDYLNIPLSQEQYQEFIEDITQGEKTLPHCETEQSELSGDEPSLRPFEGCMPIEDMCERGPETLRFGPLKPMGLTDPRTGRRPYAVIQLRQDDTAGELWSLVGMQTRLKHGEQLRIFRKLPGLQNAEFVRLGSVHRNSFINSPKCLKSTLEFRNNPVVSYPGLFFAGQITGVEGYVESSACGLVAGINAARMIRGKEPLTFPVDTAIGALIAYISDESRTNFQPMNISFGLIPKYNRIVSDPTLKRKNSKDDKRIQVAGESLAILQQFQVDHELNGLEASG